VSGGVELEQWPDTRGLEPPTDHLYRSATWLLGRHPRLAHLAARITGVVFDEDGELDIDLDHLAHVIDAVPSYVAAWRDYERSHPAPSDEDAWSAWDQDGPQADEFALGLPDFLVMSSGEAATLRLLATFASARVPFRVSDLSSMDADGQRMLADWAAAIQAAYARPAGTAWPGGYPGSGGKGAGA